MPWMTGIPHDPGACPQGSLQPRGVVAHRTYGSWPGDYQVGLGSRDPVGFHFLVGPDPGDWVQFYSTDTRCAHAGTNAYGNDLSVGIEVSGVNEDRMTDWQISAVGTICAWLRTTHGIQLVYRFSTAHDLAADHGYIPHSAVRGADHSDYWTPDDWNRIVDYIEGDTMPSAEEVAAATWSYRIVDYDAHAWLTSADGKAGSAPDRTVAYPVTVDGEQLSVGQVLGELLERVRALEAGGTSGGGTHSHEVGPPVPVTRGSSA